MSERIERLSAFTRPGHVLFDMCCDHGLIGLHALSRVSKVVFVDQSENALKALHSAIALLEPSEQCRVEVVAKAAEPIDVSPYKSADFIIAGVGVTTIVSIISALFPNGLGEHQLILSPQQDSLPLRWYLKEKGYGLLDEIAVEERGRFREILHIGAKGRPIEEDFQNESDACSRRYKSWLKDYREKIEGNRLSSRK